MKQDSSQDLILRFSIPVKASVLLVALAALFVFIPRTLQTIPEEALGPMAVFLAVPVFFLYLSIIVFTYSIRITPDRIAAEVFPNPFLGSWQCRLADISGVEKDKWWSTLSIFQYGEGAPFRITVNTLLLLGSASFSLQLLEIGGVPDIPDAARELVVGSTAIAILFLVVVDWFIYRLLNRST
jgi:hypothetical protein